MGKRKFNIVLFPNPERKVLNFNINADFIEVDQRGNVIFKNGDGKIVGVVSNPAYQIVKEVFMKEKVLLSK